MTTIDVTKVHNQAGSSLPTSLDWWQRFVPVWVDVTRLDDQRITLTPSTRRADGQSILLTPAVRRSRAQGVREFLDSRRSLDFSNAIEDDTQLTLPTA
ncbi:hypothetical protein [Streptomyces cinereoruber]|uniref:hypothetical protein n=1 Tax=Streptomyces cinereoruber TaxID=67260 RepID=UPI003625957D